jgi:protein phosphatase
MLNKKISCLGITDIGNVRDHNEDSYIADAENQICIIADGVAGSLAGEVASKFVTDQLYNALKSTREEITADKLSSLLKSINSGLIDLAKSKREYTGMSTTLVFMIKQDGKAFIGNIGDSRAYLFRSGKLMQVTKDHSLVQQMIAMQAITPQEAVNHPMKHYITMAIGNEKIIPDIREIELLRKDTLMLCTDGLTDMVSDSEIEKTLIHYKSLEDRLSQLKNKALENGGKDNISIILVTV